MSTNAIRHRATRELVDAYRDREVVARRSVYLGPRNSSRMAVLGRERANHTAQALERAAAARSSRTDRTTRRRRCRGDRVGSMAASRPVSQGHEQRGCLASRRSGGELSRRAASRRRHRPGQRRAASTRSTLPGGVERQVFIGDVHVSA